MDRTLPLIALVGPTAVGKTALSLTLAEELNAEIISVDSMQVYKYMDIGTAKPSRQEQGRVQHHLIDVVYPDEEYHAGRFVKEAKQAITTIRGRGKQPLLVGGTGLYLKSLLDGIFEMPAIKKEVRKEIQLRLAEKGSAAMHGLLAEADPVMAAKIHPHDSQRISRGLEIFESTGVRWSDLLRKQQQEKKSLPCCLIGLTRSRTELYERINLRSSLMLENGLIEEGQKLLDMGYSATLKSMQSLGYRHVAAMLAGKRDFAETLACLARDTRHYAKRQYTWFTAMHGLKWFDCKDEAGIRAYLRAFLAKEKAGNNRSDL